MKQMYVVAITTTQVSLVRIEAESPQEAAALVKEGNGDSLDTKSTPWQITSMMRVQS